MSAEQARAWRQYICLACGLIYDEELGDPDSGLVAGTRFEDIPEDWECPLCGVKKTDFAPYKKPDVDITAPQSTQGAQPEGIIVVGAGIAGWSTVKALRALDSEIPITLITACQGDVYHKPELSIAASRRLTAEALIRESGIEAAQKLGIRLLSHTFITGLSPSCKQVRTTRGTLKYTSLVLAQGARPIIPKGFPPELCWRVNDLNGWTSLQHHLVEKNQKIAIIGAGMIGCELAEDFSLVGHDVTLLDVNTRPLERLLPEYASRKMLENQQRLGITYLANTVVQKIEANDDGKKVITSSHDQVIEVDHIVVATGLRTDSRLVKNAGIDFDNGIKVDPGTLKTSISNIYALGDCVSFNGVPCRFVEPISRQANAIAHDVLGRKQALYEHHIPVIRLKTKSLPIEISGIPSQEGEWEIIQEDEQVLLMQQISNGKLVATLQLGKSKRAA